MNVLLIRLRLIGDAVFTTPAIRALRRAYPGARLDYLVERGAEAVVAHNAHLDNVIVIEHRRACSGSQTMRGAVCDCTRPTTMP